MTIWSNLRRIINKYCNSIHSKIILRDIKKNNPYSEKDLISTLSHYFTKKEGMDNIIVSKKNDDKFNRKHIKRQSLDKYKHRLTPNLLNKLFNNIKFSFNQTINKKLKKKKQRIFAVDGSTENANKEMHYTYDFRINKRETYSQFKIITLFDVINKIPIAQNISENFNERYLFKNFLLKYIRPGDIVIFDAGFYSEELFNLISNYDIKCIFRDKKDSVTSQQLFTNNSEIQVSENKRAIRYDITYKLSKKNENDDTEYISNINEFYMITNIMNESIEYIKELYHDRWYIEEYYKIIKHYMNDHNNRCKDINLLEQELIFKMIIIMLARYSILVKDINNELQFSSEKSTINFKIVLYETGTKLFDALLFTKSNKLVNKIINNCISVLIYRSYDKHYPRLSIKNRGKWYKFENYIYEPT